MSKIPASTISGTNTEIMGTQIIFKNSLLGQIKTREIK